MDPSGHFLCNSAFAVSYLPSHFVHTSAFTEQCGEKWEVTKVVEKEELGKPAERLKEKIAKPQLLASSDEMATNYKESSKGRDAMLEQMLWA